MPRLVQISAMEPEGFLPGRFPHVSELALPGSGIFRRVRAEAPDLADLVRDFLVDELRRPSVHRAVAGGEHDQIGRKPGAILHDHLGVGDALDLPGLELDRPLATSSDAPTSM